MINYLELKNYFENHKYNNQKSRQDCDILCNIEEFIKPDDIKIFYPKNLFLEDKKLEMYVLSEDKVLIGRALEGNNIELKILYLKDLKNFTCECINDCGEYYHKLILKFTTDELVFDKKEDTNRSWGHKFEEQIKNIIKILMNRTT